MKKVLSVLLAALMLGSVTGCSGSSGSAAGESSVQQEAPASSGEKVTLKVFAENTAKLTSDMFKTRMDQFQTLHPNVTMEIEEVSFADTTKKLNLAFAGGMAPDIICAAISNIASGVERGQYEDLDVYIADWADKDDIIDNLYEMGSYKGKVYGLPYSLTPQLMVYRKDYFQEAGLDPEKAPATWEEILNAAQKTMKEENGKIVRSGMSVSIDGTFNPLVFARTNGADLFDENGNYTVDSPEFAEAADYVAQLQKTSMSVNSQLEDSQHPLTTGNAAISLIAVNKLSKWLMDVPEMADKIGFIVPENKQPSMWVGANYMHLSKESKHKDLAWEFIQMSFSTENIQENYSKFGLANVRKSLQDDYAQQNPLLAGAISDAVNCGAGANKVVNFKLGSSQILAPAMQEIYYGSKSAEEILKDAKAQYEQLVKEQE